MLDKLLDQVTQMALPEDHEVVQTLISYRLYEALRAGVAVGTLCRNGHALDAAGLQERRPCLRVQRVSVVDQIARVAQESIHWIKQVPGNLLHTRTIWRNTDPCNMHRTGLHLNDKVDHVADGSEQAQDLDTEEIAGVKSFPVALEKLLPGPFAVAFRCRFDSCLDQDVRHCRATDLDLESAQRVTDLRVTPADVLAGEPDDEFADLRRLARPAGLAALRRAIVLLGSELPKPRRDGGGADDLATGLAFFGRQCLALDRQPAPLLVGKRNAFPACGLGVDLPKYANLLQQVLEPPRQLLVDGVRHHRDNELERYRKHRAQTAAGRSAFSSLHFHRKACDNPAPESLRVLGFADDAEDEVGKLGGWPEQQPAL